MVFEELDFNDAIDVVQSVTASEDPCFWADKRQHKREAVNWLATCRSHGQHWDVTIVDASNGGFGINARLPIDVGTVLQIEIDQIGTFKCRIAWLGSERCGLELLESKGDLTSVQIQGLSSLLSDAENETKQKPLSEGQLNKLGSFFEN